MLFLYPSVFLHKSKKLIGLICALFTLGTLMWFYTALLLHSFLQIMYIQLGITNTGCIQKLIQTSDKEYSRQNELKLKCFVFSSGLLCAYADTSFKTVCLEKSIIIVSHIFVVHSGGFQGRCLSSHGSQKYSQIFIGAACIWHSLTSITGCSQASFMVSPCWWVFYFALDSEILVAAS